MSSTSEIDIDISSGLPIEGGSFVVAKIGDEHRIFGNKEDAIDGVISSFDGEITEDKISIYEVDLNGDENSDSDNQGLSWNIKSVSWSKIAIALMEKQRKADE